MLASRLVLLAGFQALIALVFALRGSRRAWDASAAWWPLTVTMPNLVCIPLLAVLACREGTRSWTAP
jgi:hypothetical protein